MLLVSQKERQAAEHEQEPTDAPLVVELLTQLLCPLCVAAGEHVVTLPLRDERGLGEGTRDGAAVADVLRQLESALDVVPRGDVVAKHATTPRAPLQDVRAEAPTGSPGRSASSSAASNNETAVEMLESL